LFESAVERPAAERVAFVDAACAADADDAPAIRDEVLALIAADAGAADAADVLACAAPELVARLGADADVEGRQSLIGVQVGPWKLVRELGHGGMGAVYLGERVDGDFHQRAAIKLVRPGWDAGDLQRRFRAERRILAGLEHPQIARLIDGGETADGKPYLAMEYVDGQPLCAYCDEGRLPIAERLRLFLLACAAVAHAHRNLVVHRDIKPSNILVSASGELKLLDFGIARLLEPGADVTGTGLRLFTPEYAAPEQVRGDPVTTSADGYALGMVLFELLTGTRPYAHAASTPAAQAHAILTAEPMRPSQFAQSRDPATRELAAARRLEPRQLGASLRGDLDAIVLRALRKEPGQRYASVEALADDVQRYLEHEPVAARRGTWRYQSGRFVRRHWLATAMGAVALAGLLGGLTLALWQADNARRQQALAETEAGQARAVAEFLTDVFKAADPTTTDGRDPRASALLARAVTDIDERTDLDPAQRSGLLLAMGRAYLALKDPAHALDLFRIARQLVRESGDIPAQIEIGLEIAAALNNSSRPGEALRELGEVRRAIDAYAGTEPRLSRRFDYIMAVVLQRLDRPAEALPHIERAYRAALAADGAGTASVGQLLEVYSVLLVDLDRADAAVAVTRLNHQASKRNERLPLVWQASFASAHAFALLGAKRYAGAEVAYRDALEIRERIFGNGHPGTAVSINNVGTALRYQGRYAEAARMYERALAIRRAQATPNSLKIAGLLATLGESWRGAGEPEKAIVVLREGLALYDERRDGDAALPTELVLRVSLARALEATGEFSEAIVVLAPVLDRTRREESAYAGAAGVGVRLLQTRLLARSTPAAEDCGVANATLGLAPEPSPQATEARILAADCESRNGRATLAGQHLVGIAASDEDLREVSAYARERLAALRRMAQ
jgi:serine/threonine-protein kinase